VVRRWRYAVHGARWHVAVLVGAVWAVGVRVCNVLVAGVSVLVFPCAVVVLGGHGGILCPPEKRYRRRVIDDLARTFHGEIITPESPGYDDARRVWNAVFDRRPAGVLRPTSVAG